MIINRPEKWGGPLTYMSYADLAAAYGKELHSQDLKKAVAGYVIELLRPIREYFKRKPENYKFGKNLRITR